MALIPTKPQHINCRTTQDNGTERAKYTFRNLKTGEYVKSYHMSNDGGRSHIGIDFTKNPDEALHLTSIPYEPNQTRLAELLTSLTDAIYKAEIYTGGDNA